MADKAKRDVWRRSKVTTSLVNQLRGVVKEAGFTEEFAVVPLLNEYSVLVSNGENFANVRINKETMKVVSVERLRYIRRKDFIARVYRHKL